MKLDSQRRLQIPQSLLKDIGFQFPCRVRLVIEQTRILLLQHTEENSDIEYHDVINMDSKGRCVLKKQLLQTVGVADSSEFMISALQNHVIIRWK